MSPMTTKNSTGDNMQHCLTTLPTTKGAEREPLCSTRHLAPLYVYLMTETILLDIPLLLGAIQRPSLSMLSKAFAKSTKTKPERYSTLCSMIIRSVLIWSTQEVPNLFTIFGGMKMVFYPIQYDLGDDFGDCGQDTYSWPIIAGILEFSQSYHRSIPRKTLRFF